MMSCTKHSSAVCACAPAKFFLQGFFAGIVGIIVWGVLLYSMKSDDFDALFLSLRRKIFTIDVLPREWDGEKTTAG